jgi:His/Glu/Gln/Arg/opine family amino acid ABC transporter permease subunit
MQFQFGVVWQALPVLAEGMQMTVMLVLASLAVGIAIGAVICAGKLLRRGLLYHLAFVYVGLFRGLPETVLIFWMYYCGPLILDARLSGFTSGVLALALVGGAYLAEIFRAGVEAVPKGQIEAARALGVSGWWVGWSIVAPQAIRIMTPAFVGFLTILLKNSSLISAIGVGELFYQASVLGGETFRHFELFTAVGIIYFVMIFPLSLLAQRMERQLAFKQQ